MNEINTQLVLSKIAKLHDLTPLGRGGQKIVFSGFHEDHNKVVVKLIISSQPDQRVLREIEVMTECSIPNTAMLYEWGTFDSVSGPVLYIVEELIEGHTLRQEIENESSLPTTAVLQLVATLLETAVFMENEGLVHRDIKPENIMVCDANKFKLLDFGIARHLAKTSITPTDARFGPHTAGYAAPEQFRNLKKQIDIRTDLFAIGVVAYECLSGKHPFVNGARDRLDILRRTEQLTPVDILVDEDRDGLLTSFIAVMMNKYPSRRPPYARAAKGWFDDIRGQLYLDEK